MTTLFTVGHGARSLDDFIEILLGARIEVLADVRRYPGSRRHPHFGREALAASLAGRGIKYEWWGEKLGGHRRAEDSARHHALRNDSFRSYAVHMETPEFREALAELEKASLQRRIAVMCAETLWWRCHRRLIADALVAKGHEVIHLGLSEPAPHELSPLARLTNNGLLVYDVQTSRSEPRKKASNRNFSGSKGTVAREVGSSAFSGRTGGCLPDQG